MPAVDTKKWGRGREAKPPDHVPFRDHVLSALMLAGLAEHEAARAIREAVDFGHAHAPDLYRLWNRPMIPGPRDNKLIAVLMMTLPDWALARTKRRRKPKPDA